MSNNCCSENSSHSLGDCQSHPASSSGSSNPSNMTCNIDLSSCGPCQCGTALSSGCQGTGGKPFSCHTSGVVSSPCLTSCSRPRPSTPFSPSQTTTSGPQGCGSSSSCSQSYEYGSSYIGECGSSNFRPQARGVHNFPSLNYVFGYCHPDYLTSSTCRASCYRST
ncbi:PREDICTED: keratin-associated protein 13-1-like [Condylura cristata]|uniref:keratin-associated protein 13-1-like n=1 Tax=Condylura cristata TaxID=143302 RepID=UPI000642AD29|nr:PREDICTED: keratin-associated protein 13-1-like [Condylura cristata]